jgi:hypothetical protein
MDIKEQITQYLNTLNQTQKIILGFVVGLFIILLFAHNPFSGYITEQEWHSYPSIGPDATIDRNWAHTPKNWDKALPFSLWRTNSPLIDWLGNARNFIYSIMTIFLIGAIFVGFVFSNGKQGKKLD